MRNRFAGKCYRCGKWCEKGEGHFELIRGGEAFGKKWQVHCVECAIKNKEKKARGEGVEPSRG